MLRTLFALVLALGAPDVAGAQHVHAQHGSGGGAATSTLSAEEVRQLLEGDGAGMAKAAELNGYPGPKHILERAEQLGLTPDQHEKVTEIRARMLAEAQRLGRSIVHEERALDDAFRTRAISRSDLATRTRTIGSLKGDLRAAHLAAHLESLDVLSPEQVRTYYEMGAHGTQGK